MIINSFQPLRLRIEGNGPFPGNPYEVDFTDEEGQPCNIFLLMSENGMGKTTVLEIMAALMGMLGKKEIESCGVEGLDNGELAVQWDILVQVVEDDNTPRNIVLSLLAGNFSDETGKFSEDRLFVWSDEDLHKHGAERQEKRGFQWRAKGTFRFISQNHVTRKKIQTLFRQREGADPDDFEISSCGLPTLLHFSAYRDIPKITSQKRQISEPDYWGYSPVRRFSSHSTSWENSLDNVLVWMKWLDDGRLEKAVEIINKRVFQGSTTFIKGVRKTPPEAIVVSKGQEHGLDRLSSGEKNLVQLFLRIGAHCTRNSIILIDEPEIHLHPNWQKRLMKQLREFAQEHPGITIILATHSIEMLRAFGFEHKEKGLRKGGEIIEENME
ncbi:AAA domain-containing protein [Candidatus Electrothrix marina]|uniref:AAA domain-containing protein n=1 Tax=Candidatus Electrothrix marina TaxID=1859130 RepID=A0A444JGR4_9BACT|nr:AAA domain-containing protein [Candidatus Electrothrix marina]